MCKECVLQLLWETSKGIQYKCADISIIAGGGKCEKICLKHGKCVEGTCICSSGYIGYNCESRIDGKVDIFRYVFIFLIVTIIFSILGIVIYLYFHQEKIPIKIQNFLNKHAKWCLRYEPIQEEIENK